eukprot:scaffold295_cov167-Ochromonas_danica.AAC.7
MIGLWLVTSFVSYRERRLGVVQGKTDSVARLTSFLTELSLWPLLRKADLVSDHNQGLAVEGAFCDLGYSSLIISSYLRKIWVCNVLFYVPLYRLMHLAGGPEGVEQAVLERLLRQDVPSEEEIEAAGRDDPELW